MKGTTLILLIPFIIMWEGLAMMLGWNRLVVTIFHFAPLGLAQATGLLMVCHYASRQWIDVLPLPEEEQLNRNQRLVLGHLYVPLVAIINTYVISLFL